MIQNCQGGSIWNQNTWACECPSTTVWTNSFCIANPCIGGQIWDNAVKVCVCIGNRVFINNTCLPPQSACLFGQIWDARILVCRCPDGQWFNSTYCEPIQRCVNNQIYNPLINRCVCPPGLIFLSSKQVCGDPTCPVNKRWDGQSCVDLVCPPNSFFNGTECVCPNPSDRCLPWELFDGEKCVYFQDTCPRGTRWNGTMCASVTGDCPNGYYKDVNQCKPFPQRCLPSTTWNNNKCIPDGSSCPYGTVGQANSCQPYSPCQNGQQWDSGVLQCVCPKGTGWSGKECVVCAGGQIWNMQDGCTCPEGFFMSGARCERPAANMCKLIPNAYWNGNRQLCLCNPGFSVVGYQCVCKTGVQYENFCDRCSYRPNSEFYFGICRCKTGYTNINGQCLPNLNDGNNVATDCNVATFFDSQQKKCLPCPDGCLQCRDCYTCIQCNPDFVFDPATSLCSEICGDGKRYVRECDDGNRNDNDGCSSSCTIELGYTCVGGSPTSSDNCRIYTPSQVSFQMLGQIRYSTKVVLNIKIDYLPKQLMQSSDCNDRCSQVLVASVLSGDSPTSIRSSYVSGSRYTFSVELEFGKPYVSRFRVEIKVNPSLSRYFQAVSIGNTFVTEVNPSQLTLAVVDNNRLS